MKYKEIFVRSETLAQLKNELLFEIASQRASGVELIRFNVYNKGDATLFLKIINWTKKQMRSFKNRGIIQFFATAESFLGNDTESKYLINKYPELFESIPQGEENSFFVYIKL